jgi:hypothetical protein
MDAALPTRIISDVFCPVTFSQGSPYSVLSQLMPQKTKGRDAFLKNGTMRYLAALSSEVMTRSGAHESISCLMRPPASNQHKRGLGEKGVSPLR